MFLNFFYDLRKNKIPVGTKEFLLLQESLEKGLANYSLDDFYFLTRSIFVKNEQYLDVFDRVFGEAFQGLDPVENLEADIDESWIKDQLNRTFSKEELEVIEAMGGLEELMERFKELLDEQKERHQGGNKWIGTGGVSPFGNSGYKSEGIRVGGESKHRKALKVWEKRLFKDYRGDNEIGSRNFKLALKRLRHFTRQGTEEELNLKETISKTTKNAGYIDIVMQPETKNNVKVLLLMDVGGSMDDHVETCSRLFTAAKAEFKHLKHYYFHNFLYESIWDNNNLRFSERISMWDILNKYNSDYKLIFVGDASMSPYEILSVGGSVEHHNKEAGVSWFNRLTKHFPNFIWINPTQIESWDYVQSIEITKELCDNRMFPMTIDGISNGMKLLKDKKTTRRIFN